MATVNFIPYRSQSATALSRVADYVSQKDKTLDEQSRTQLVSGINCSPQFAVQEFRAVRAAHQMLGEIQTAAARLATKEELQAYLDSRVQELENCVRETQTTALDFQKQASQIATVLTENLTSQAGRMSDSFSQNLSLEQDRMKRYSTRLFWISLIPSAALVILELILRIWPVI